MSFLQGSVLKRFSGGLETGVCSRRLLWVIRLKHRFLFFALQWGHGKFVNTELKRIDRERAKAKQIEGWLSDGLKNEICREVEGGLSMSAQTSGSHTERRRGQKQGVSVRKYTKAHFTFLYDNCC